MAGPIANKVILPDDSGNLGKKIRTQARVVGADTVHEHFFIPSSKREKLGIYKFHSGVLSISATAQNGTSTGFLWLINTDSTKGVAVRRLEFILQITTNLSMPTSPRLLVQQFTFTGTPSGASLTLAKADTTYPAAVGSVRTAMTGMTVTLQGMEWATYPPVTAGTAGWTFVHPNIQEYEPKDEDGFTLLRSGEGLVIYQPDAGTTADTRKAIVNGAFEEYDLS